MDEERIKSLVIAWYQKGIAENDLFSRFVFLWFCLNVWLAHESEQYHDRDMINWVKAAPESSLRRAFTQIDDIQSIDGLAQLSPIRGDSMRRRDRERQNIEIQDRYDFENIVEAIYRIRCNLFHARKDADNERDQRLVDVSGRILNSWVGQLIRDWD
jgi:hypothetical protein